VCVLKKFNISFGGSIVLFYNMENKQITALLLIIGLSDELKHKSIDSIDETGYFQVEIFKEKTKHLKSANHILGELVIALINNNESFPIGYFASLNDDNLKIVFEAIRIFKSKQLEDSSLSIEPLSYLSQTDVAKMMQSNNFNMDRRKVSVYYRRGHLPKPEIYVGNHPGWREATMKKWIEDYKAGKVLERRI